MNEPIRFDDGAAYERYMGKWSQLVGATFLNWLAPKPALRWLDVGCGNGAFTELFVAQCAPALVWGIDPSAAQLAYARTRPALRGAQFLPDDAMALSFPDDTFDIAVMPLVIFFVPQPARGVAEMARVVSPGGRVAAYAWDMEGGGFPYDLLRSEMAALGLEVPTPPSPEASRMDALVSLRQYRGPRHCVRRLQRRAAAAFRNAREPSLPWRVCGGYAAPEQPPQPGLALEIYILLYIALWMLAISSESAARCSWVAA